MKKIVLIILLLFIVSVSLTGCKSNEELNAERAEDAAENISKQAKDAHEKYDKLKKDIDDYHDSLKRIESAK